MDQVVRGNRLPVGKSLFSGAHFTIVKPPDKNVPLEAHFVASISYSDALKRFDIEVE